MAKSNESVVILIVLVFATVNHFVFLTSNSPDFPSPAFLLNLQPRLPTWLDRFSFPLLMLAFLRGLSEILLSVHATPSFLGELTYSHGFKYHPVLDKAKFGFIHPIQTVFTDHHFCKDGSLGI